MNRDNYYNSRNSIKEEDRNVVRAAIITSFIIFGFITFGMYKYIVYLNDNKLIEVPDLHTELYDETAEKYAEQFDISVIDEQVSNVYEVGSILSQSVEPGTLVSKGTKIQVVVSSNPNNLKMPDLEARTLNDAKKTLSKYNVSIETILEESEKIEAGFIIKSEPSFEQKLTLGQTVKLYISTGSPESEKDNEDEDDQDDEDDDNDNDDEENSDKKKITKKRNDSETSNGKVLPNFVGLTESEARSKAKELGIKVGKIEYQNGASSSNGTVSWQSVKKETPIKKVDSINFLIVPAKDNTNASRSDKNKPVEKPSLNTIDNDVSEENISDEVESKTKLVTISIAPNFELISSTYNVQIIVQDSDGTRIIYNKPHDVGDFPFTKKFNLEIGSTASVYINEKLINEQRIK